MKHYLLYITGFEFSYIDAFFVLYLGIRCAQFLEYFIKCIVKGFTLS